MTIALPELPRDATYSMRKVRGATSVLRPAFGGPRLPLSRKGDHWAIDVDVGGLHPDCAAALVADLVQGDGETLHLALPKMGTDAVLAVNPVVFGGGQAGSILTAGNLPVAYPVRKGRFFSLVSGGRRYVHIIVAPSIANGSGITDLAIWPMLRVSPANGDVIEFIAPRIEGFVEDGGAFETGILPIGTPKAFTIEERA